MLHIMSKAKAAHIHRQHETVITTNTANFFTCDTIKFRTCLLNLERPYRNGDQNILLGLTGNN